MMEELKAGDFVLIKGREEKPFTYMVVSPAAENIPVNVGGMTLVARWYRTDMLTKIKT